MLQYWLIDISATILMVEYVIQLDGGAGWAAGRHILRNISSGYCREENIWPESMMVLRYCAYFFHFFGTNFHLHYQEPQGSGLLNGLSGWSAVGGCNMLRFCG